MIKEKSAHNMKRSRILASGENTERIEEVLSFRSISLHSNPQKPLIIPNISISYERSKIRNHFVKLT